VSTPAGTGPLALLDLPDPCVMGTGDIVAAYGLAARLLTPPDAPAEWGEPEPVACLDLRAALGSRLDDDAVADWQRRCNEVLAQDERVSSVSATLTFANGVLTCVVRAVGAAGPFTFTLTVDQVNASLLMGA
jgi:hypothetical protein